ncbi:zf-HC2 domain-containing protein [Streptomyces hoynatensis]|uniref:zf-HC2 domain-containing protein n=1 Tax=Streptomyces hoynatensis TaxID=1141874 RepID=UPI001F4ED8A3|nr:zf-HC2 domain-containing protein [Streptomyces hoynatensis]
MTHEDIAALLGAWALGACAPEEAWRVEAHLEDCTRCAEEGLQLRDAAMLLEPPASLDLDPRLRNRVLEGCLERRPAKLPVPSWAEPLDAEAARLDALLHDMAEDEWRTPVTLRWFEDDHWLGHTTTVSGVLHHLLVVDGLLAGAVGLPDPAGPAPGAERAPVARTLAAWRAGVERPAWLPWREQTRALVRAAAARGGRTGERTVPRELLGEWGLFPGAPEIALSDAYLDRAFACWVHATDIAEAVSYPYGPPVGPHLRLLVDLAARRLPGSIADRRRAGLASSPIRLASVGAPGRTLHLEIEGPGGGHWYLPLDSPAAAVSRTAARRAVAHLALEDVAFCQLAAGRLTPEEVASGGEGDPAVIHDVLFAVAALSRL